VLEELATHADATHGQRARRDGDVAHDQSWGDLDVHMPTRDLFGAATTPQAETKQLRDRPRLCHDALIA
jgi:hypothetical protein